MKKHFLFFGMAAIMMASCTTDDFLGENANEGQNGLAPIQFSGEAPSLTRATGVDAAEELGFNFNVLGAKQKGTTDPIAVSALTSYNTAGLTDAQLYKVWYNEGTAAGSTTTNPSKWEYVGSGTVQMGKTAPYTDLTLSTAQTIKYWDYSYDQYHFVAYANTKNAEISDVKTNAFTVKGTAEELAGLYIADKRVIAKANYKNEVEFTFRAGAAKVRLGIYETIPGYNVRNVKFRSTASPENWTATDNNNVQLDGTFMSNGTSTNEVTYTVTVGDADNTVATIAPATGYTTAKYYDFGAFLAANAHMGETATAPSYATNATGTAAYINVLPNTSDAGVMTLYVDYQLYNSVTQEVIQVTGAKAAVPAAYMTWLPNHAYTYLFKITDNTNGTTGTEGGTDPTGLFPITFDAVTVATTEKTQGIETTVATPTITTYAAGSVSDAGITYTTASTPVYVTVSTDGTLADLTSKMSLYSVAENTTEADLQLASYTKPSATGLTVETADDSSTGINFTANKYAKITGLTAGWYAIEYAVSTTVKHYKVIKVTATTTP